MSILTMPDVPIGKVNFKLIPRNTVFESELSGDIQVSPLPGDRWSAVLTVTNLMGREALLWTAFLARLGGRRGRFWLSPPGARTPMGTALGAGRVAGANQTGDTLITSNWTPDQSELLIPGDYFQVGNELKKVVEHVPTNGAGEATIVFTPIIRRSPADLASIITTNPAFVAMLADDNQAAWDVQGARIYASSVACIEALDL